MSAGRAHRTLHRDASLAFRKERAEAGLPPGTEAVLAGRPVPLGADALAVHHTGPDGRLAEADLPAAHGKDQAGAGELPALRASGGAGAQRSGHFLQQASIKCLLHARPEESCTRPHHAPSTEDLAPSWLVWVPALGTEPPGASVSPPCAEGSGVLTPRLTEPAGWGPGSGRVSDGVTSVLRVKWGGGQCPLRQRREQGGPGVLGAGLECWGPRGRPVTPYPCAPGSALVCVGEDRGPAVVV